MTNPKTLRTWQKEAIDRLKDQRLSKVTAFTGSGKSLAISGLTALKLKASPNKRAIIAVPQKDISASWTGNKINYNNKEYLLSTSNLTKDNASKKEALLTFLKRKQFEGKAAVCTQQLLALSQEELKDLKNIIFVLDEAHHSKAADDNGESNGIGALVDHLAKDESNEIILATATFFRGDKANILSADLESNLESYSCGFDQTIQGFQYLESVSTNVNMYEDDSFENSLRDYIQAHPERNGIIFIPPVGSSGSSGKEQDLQAAINAIAGVSNPTVHTCANTGFNWVQRGEDKVYFADLVSESNDRDAIKTSIDDLKGTRGSRNMLHYIIALNMFKEGSDWPDCDDAHIISQRGSLTTFVQMAGRALRDAKGKKEANVIYHIPTDNKEECCKDDINRFFGAFAHIMIFNTLTDEKIVIPSRKATTENPTEHKQKKMSVIDVANELGINEQELTDTITDVNAKLAVWDSNNPDSTEEEKMEQAKSLFSEELEDHSPNDDQLYVLAKSLLKQNRRLTKQLAEKPEDFDFDMCDENVALFDWVSSKALDADFLSKVRDYFENKEWLEPEEIKAFFKENGISTMPKWQTFRKENPELVKDIPSMPHEALKGHGHSWAWYVGKQSITKNAWLEPEEIKVFFAEKGIKTHKQWTEYRKEHNITNIPAEPSRAYKSYGYSTAWYLGKGSKKEFLKPLDIKAYFKAHEITSQDQWRAYRKQNNITNIPSVPHQAYKEYGYSWNWYIGKE